MSFKEKNECVEFDFEIGDLIFSYCYGETGVIVCKVKNSLSFGYNTKYLMGVVWDGDNPNDVRHRYWPVESIFKIITEKEGLALRLKYSK
jgi:hypothetical protein